MSKKKDSSQSISISNSSITGQIAQSSSDISQTQNIQSTSQELADTISALNEIKILVEQSNFLEKERVMGYLNVTIEEVLSEKPEKEFASKNLLRVTEALKNVNSTVSETQNLFDKIKPILIRILPWLGVTKKFFGL